MRLETLGIYDGKLASNFNLKDSFYGKNAREEVCRVFEVVVF